MFGLFSRKKEIYRADSISIIMGTQTAFSYDLYKKWLDSGYLGFSPNQSLNINFGGKRDISDINDLDFNAGFRISDKENGIRLSFTKPSAIFPFQINWKFDKDITISLNELETFLGQIDFFACYVFDRKDLMWQSTDSLDNYVAENKSTKGLKIIQDGGENFIDISRNVGRKFAEREFIFFASPTMFLGTLWNEIFTFPEVGKVTRVDSFPLTCDLKEARIGQSDVLKRFKIIETYNKLKSRDYEKIHFDMENYSEDDDESIEMV